MSLSFYQVRYSVFTESKYHSITMPEKESKFNEAWINIRNKRNSTKQTWHNNSFFLRQYTLILYPIQVLIWSYFQPKNKQL